MASVNPNALMPLPSGPTSGHTELPPLEATFDFQIRRMMTLVNLDALVPPPGGAASGRAALALSQAIFDSQVRPKVVPFGSPLLSDDPATSYFDKLLEQEGCKDAWNNYTKTTSDTFGGMLASGKLSLNGFRHYTIQDAIYLEYYVRVRMAAVGSWDSKVSSDEFRKFVEKQPSTLGYSRSTRADCTDQLGVPKADVDREWVNDRSSELENSIKNYEDVIFNAVGANGGNSWLDIHFALLPCIKGYFNIADDLLKSTTTFRNTLYYTMWIVPNADSSSVKKYDDFLQRNSKDADDDQWEAWGKIFKQACDNELAFFNLGLKNRLQYEIVTAAMVTSCTIHPFSQSSKYLSFTAGGTEVIISTTSTKWTLKNSEKGYDLISDTKYLCFKDQKLSAESASKDDTKWYINSVPVMGTNKFMLFPSGAIHSALDCDANDKVSVAKNDPTTQVWILNPAA